MNRKIVTMITAAAFSLMMTATALAGTWTHRDSSGQGYYDYWLYIKDNGQYAAEEWIQDTDGVWYWIEADQMLPIIAGVATDGSRYTSKGVYIDMSSRKFPTQEMYRQLRDNMPYEEVFSILGEPHELYSSSFFAIGTDYRDEAVYLWYTPDMQGGVVASFLNGRLEEFYGHWY